MNKPWINIVGGYGDTLMVSGVLKAVVDHQPGRTFNLIRRTQYTRMLAGHPAIERIGFPPREAQIMKTDYWAMERLGAGSQRPFQILARAFALATPIKEDLYLPGSVTADGLVINAIPLRKKNIVIAPTSDSPRKMLNMATWRLLVDRLSSKDVLVIQVGRASDHYVKGAYSLLGLTSPQQLVALLKAVDLVVTLDNFVMHAAHLAGTPAIAIFGPTEAKTYGYDEQVLLAAPVEGCEYRECCLGAGYPKHYTSPCPLGSQDHCINKIAESAILGEILKIVESGYWRYCE